MQTTTTTSEEAKKLTNQLVRLLADEDGGNGWDVVFEAYQIALKLKKELK